jgi:hypothetical protein
MDWVTEAAKQVPALAVVVGLVVYFLKHSETESKASEDRLVAEAKACEDRLTKITEQQDRTIAALTATLTANNTVLGSITTLLTLVENDLKRGNK